VYKLIKAQYTAAPRVERHERRRLNRNFSYRVVLSDSAAAKKMLTQIGVLGDGDVSIAIKSELVRLSCCEGAFLRGLFLGCGSMADPEKEYRLEFVIEDEQLAKSAAALLAGAEIPARIMLRKGKFVSYIADADHISELLALAGAHTAMLKFESIRVEKEVRNAANRMVNCDTANADRTVRASGREIESIELIDQHAGIAKLPRELRETAQARLNNPDATLERLADAMGVSKSGLNHRFRRLEQIAGEYRRKEE
jgi:DNA-binding protein WhiA